MCIYSKIKGHKTYLNINANDENQILTALNSKKYSFRQDVDSQAIEDLLEIARKEMLNQQHYVSERRYCDNCHTLTRIAKSQFNWEVVYGYAFLKSSIGNQTLVLRHHSVSKDDSGNLIELTAAFNVEDCEFIEHQSACKFTDLQAYH